LTDVVMPGMGGRELAQHLSVIKPNLKILFISGYIDDVGLHAGLEEGSTSFLQKPFTPEALARAVRELLDMRLRAGKSNATSPAPRAVLH